MIHAISTTQVHTKSTAIEHAMLTGNLTTAEMLIDGALATATLAERAGLIRMRDLLDQAQEKRKRVRSVERGVA